MPLVAYYVLHFQTLAASWGTAQTPYDCCVCRVTQSRGGHRSVTLPREWQQVNRSQLMPPKATFSQSVQELLVNKGHTCSNLLSVVQYLGQSKIWCDA